MSGDMKNESTDDNGSPTVYPPKTIHIQEAEENGVYGVDAIWHNVYRGPQSDFGGMRKAYSHDIDTMIKLVAKHVSQGLYTIVSLNATKYSLTVVCICEKIQDEVLDGHFDDLPEW